jgi:hypothetical protein
VTAPLVQRLSLVVDAATGGTEARMDALATSSREAGAAAERSAGQVAAAAERVAAAQLRRDDAADRVALAERRLAEAQGRYARDSSQVLAAEQRLESARRQHHQNTRAVERAEEDLTRAQNDAAESTARAATEQERAGASSDRLRGQMDNLKGAAAGLVGFGVGDWARDQMQAYLNGARGAQTLATSMNATVQQGGQLSQLFASLGLDSADLLEIQAEFATKIGENGRNLEAFGASLETNANGTINWAGTLTDALVHLQQIPDATERNRLGFQLFGEEGYKQLSRLLTSGMSVEDALDAIGTPFSAEDVRTAQEYDAAMFRLSLESGELGRTFAREVVPAAAGVLSGLNSVLGIITQIPAPLALATTAALVMGRTGFSPLTRLSELVSTGMDRVRTSVTTAAGGVEAGAGRMARGVGIARAGVGGLSSMLGGPFGIAMIAGTALFAAVSEGAEELEEHARDAAVALSETDDAIRASDRGTREAAASIVENAGAWENANASMRGFRSALEEDSGMPGWLSDLTASGPAGGMAGIAGLFGETEMATRGAAESIEDAAEELGEYGAQQQLAAESARSLNDLIAQGTTSGDEFGEAVQRAADAERDQSRTSDMAAAALAAYRAQTDQAVEAVRGLIDAQLSQRDAGFAFLDAMDDLNEATDDAETSVDEVAQAHVALQEAALRAGDAAADAAVAQARAAGTIVTPLDEARIRADALITDLQGRLNTPGLSEAAQRDLQVLIDQLTEAREKGDVNALVTLTGVDAARGDLEDVGRDRQSRVNVESRGGPAVVAYLDRVAEDRLTRVMLESRGGPAVVSYVERITRDRLSLIRLESRGGPAVDRYVDGLAAERLALIRVETRGGPDVDRYLDGLANQRRVAIIDTQTRAGAGGGGTGTPLAGLMGAGGALMRVENLNVTVQADQAGRVTASAAADGGRQVVRQLAEYTRQNGSGWLQGLQR